MQRTDRIPHFFESFLTAIFFTAGFFVAGVLCPRSYPMCLPVSVNAASKILTSRGGTSAINAYSRMKSPFESLQFVLPVNLDEAEETGEPKIKKAVPDSVRTIVAEKPTSRKVLVSNDSGYDINTEEILAEPFRFSKKPAVLILHTHTSESYTPSEKYNYTQSDTFRSEDAAFNVTLIGDEMTKVLSERGIKVIHNKTSHDYPSYSGSYKRSLETATSELSAHPDIGIVLDIHRDALSDKNGYFKMIADDNETPCAQGMIVVGTDGGGLEHPDWRRNLSLAVHMQKFISDKYPSLMRPIHLRSERFNGHVSPGAVIIEVGSCGNTMEEALVSAQYISEAIADMIVELSE